MCPFDTGFRGAVWRTEIKSLVATGWQTPREVKQAPSLHPFAFTLFRYVKGGKAGSRPTEYPSMTMVSPSDNSSDFSDAAARLASVNWTAIAALTMIAFWVLTIASSVGEPAGWLYDGRGMPSNSDYNNVYTAGQLVRAGEPAAAYDWERHKQMQLELTGDAKSVFFPWPYPPMFLFVASLLALMPYALSMFAWSMTTLALYATALWRIAATPTQFLILLAMPAAWLNVFVGQNGAFTAALIGFALIALPVRPILAGVCIGMLSYKPHLGLLFPIALAAAGHWRAFFSAGVTVAALVVATLLVFGVAPWMAMPGQIEHVMSIVKVADYPERIQSLFGLSISLGAPPAAGSAVQLMMTLFLAASTAWTWRRKDVAYELKAALLVTALTLASPYQFVYDLPVLTIAQAFLLRYMWREHAMTLSDIGVLVLVNLFVYVFAATPVPLGVFGSLTLLAYVLHKIRVVTVARTSAAPAATNSGKASGRARVLIV